MALPEYRLNPTNRAARDIVNTMVSQMDMDPPYQRGHVWTVEQRQELIKSWIMGVPVGGVIVNLRDNRGWRQTTGEDVYEGGHIWACVDGKQRIETASQWFNGYLAVPRDWFDPEHVEGEIYGKPDLVSYKCLSLAMQRRHGHSFQILMSESQLPSLEAEAELFLLVNGGGTAQEPEVMENARKLAREGQSR